MGINTADNRYTFAANQNDHKPERGAYAYRRHKYQWQGIILCKGDTESELRLCIQTFNDARAPPEMERIGALDR